MMRVDCIGACMIELRQAPGVFTKIRPSGMQPTFRFLCRTGPASGDTRADVRSFRSTPPHGGRPRLAHLLVTEAGGNVADVGLACLGAWAVAHGLAKLAVGRGLDPARYGVADVEELAQLALRRMRLSVTAGSG